MRLFRTFSIASLLLCVTFFATSGCTGTKTPPLGKVQGTITLDGEPLADAAVTFDPIGLEFGGASTGKTDASGMYTLDYVAPLKGAVVAEHTVRIDVVRGAPTEGDPLPAKYNTKTELKATVDAGDNVIDFDLESK